MDLTLPIIGVTSLVGYLLNRPKENEPLAPTPLAPPVNEQPTATNMYTSNGVVEANRTEFENSLANYNAAQNPAMTGMIPPLFNIYSQTGNLDAGNNMNSTNAETRSYIETTDNRLLVKSPNVTPTTQSRPQDNPSKPMFKPILNYLGTEIEQENNTAFDGSALDTGVSLLTGLPLERQHNNMVPFFGSTVKQNTEGFANVARLDHFTGNRDTYQPKTETSQNDFFAPIVDFENGIRGTPIVTDIINKDRFITSNFREGEKPFYEERIPYIKANAVDNPLRENARPRTIDELRTRVNPKLTYEGRTVAGQRASVRGIQAKLVKNRVASFYEQTPDQWLITDGAYKNERMRGEEYLLEEQSNARNTQNRDYYGGAYNSTYGKYKPVSVRNRENHNNREAQTIEEPSRRTNVIDATRNMNPNERKDTDYGRSGYFSPEQERETTNGELFDRNINLENRGIGYRSRERDTPNTTTKETTLYERYGNVDDSPYHQGNAEAFELGINQVQARATQQESVLANNYIPVASRVDGKRGYVHERHITTDRKERTLVQRDPMAGNGGRGQLNSGKSIIGEDQRNNTLRDARQRDNTGPFYAAVGHHKQAIGEVTAQNKAKLEECQQTFDTDFVRNQLASNPYVIV